MTPPGRKPLHGEEGFALIEVLVSALILAIVAGGVLALLQATTRAADQERRHAEAYSLAQEDQARLRSLRLSTLNRLSQSEEKTLEGTVFTVESQGVFINNTKRQPSNCTSGETSADYVRITSTVSWADSSNPVVLTSIVSPSNGSLDPNRGTLLVTTTKTGGETLPGVGLSGTGPGTFSGTTDSTGCANFSDLPAGNYKVTPSGTNLVGTDGLPPHEEEVGVSAGTTATLSLQYDTAASIPVEFEYAAGSGDLQTGQARCRLRPEHQRLRGLLESDQSARTRLHRQPDLPVPRRRQHLGGKLRDQQTEQHGDRRTPLPCGRRSDDAGQAQGSRAPDHGEEGHRRAEQRHDRDHRRKMRRSVH